MSKFFSSFNRCLGLDLGSSRTRVWLKNNQAVEPILLDEPSLIAVDQVQNKVVAIGQAAADMQGRVGGQVKVFSPICHPKITDDELLRVFLKLLLRQLNQKVYLFSPTMLVSLPSSVYPVMREVVVEVLTELGANEVFIIDQSLAAAIGAGIPVADASGSFLLQLGAGVVEASAISLTKIVQTQTSFKAGNDIRQELIYWFADNKHLKISQSIAQQVLQNLGNLSDEANFKLGIIGLAIKEQQPLEVEVRAQEVRQVIEAYGQQYVILMKKLLAMVPPDLTIDVIDKGLLLSGGLSKLAGLEQYLVEQLKIPVSTVDDPDLAVIRGVGLVLQHLDEFKTSLGY